MPVSPKYARRFNAIALMGAPLSTPSQAGLPLMNARMSRWFCCDRVSGNASKRGDEVSCGLFVAADEISAARNSVVSRTDTVLWKLELAEIFTRRRIALFLLRESGFTFSPDVEINATRDHVLALLDSDDID